METSNQKTYIFHVHGMHCKSCTVLIESELNDVPEICSTKASLKYNHVEVMGNFGNKPAEEIMAVLAPVIKQHGYTLSLEKQKHNVKWNEFKIAFPIAFGFLAVFILLQKLGVVNLVNVSEIGLGAAFLIGIIASISSCMAVVGGLVLSMSANYAKEGDKVKPQVLFHIGRLVAFFALGGVIGALGSAFQLGIVGTFILGILVGLIMIILGINLLDVFPWAKKLQLTLPAFFSNRIHGLKKVNHTLTPLLVGVVTFFLPCGFTQSMQIYTLTTGSFWTGAMTMLTFALGTLPVLALLSFSTSGIHKKAQSGIFFKTAGLVVLFFGLFNVYNSLVAVGVLPPLFNF